MAIEVLKSRATIRAARRELRRRNLSFTSSWWHQFWYRLGVSGRLRVGDELKSWDVLRTAQFIQENVAKDARILDIGAFASELLYVLHNLGYSELTGIDLNPEIKKMAYSDRVRYEVSNFGRTSFEDESFSVITAVSVIEHGFDSKRLLSEVSRLLSCRGFFIASFDYWPDKQNTDGISFFGMDWRIFSRDEVRQFVSEAVDYGLHSYGEVDLEAEETPITCGSRKYTFAWLVLQKRS